MARRLRMARSMRTASGEAPKTLHQSSYDAPRRIHRTTIDFGALDLAADVRLAFAEAFWMHYGMLSTKKTILVRWRWVNEFCRFVDETSAVECLADIDGDMLVRYVEWLNSQVNAKGRTWSKNSRSGAYSTIRVLLQWIERCRPELLIGIDYPSSPFPFRNHSSQPKARMPAHALRALLKACNKDIAMIRTRRAAAEAERANADGSQYTLGTLLNYFDEHFDGIVPPYLNLVGEGSYAARRALARFGGVKAVEPCLYPRPESLFPYYVAILIHTAGNPDPIAEIQCDCLQALPLLSEREAIVWFKSRSHRMQRRTFNKADPFQPPSLVREILEWTQPLRRLASAEHRDRLFLYKTSRGVRSLVSGSMKKFIRGFCERHKLARFSLDSIRPSVLEGFYIASGDLRKTQAVANHSDLATTIRYVETPLVKAKNDTRIAALQHAFVEHLEQRDEKSDIVSAKGAPSDLPAGSVTTMFGFDCRNPFDGIAPGSRRGELCTNFMGCFACPNAVIPDDPNTLARLLQTRDHFRAGEMMLHPARWEIYYQPLLQILEQDILPRFGAAQLASAEVLVQALPPLPELR